MFLPPAHILATDLLQRRLYHQSGVKSKEKKKKKFKLVSLYQKGFFLHTTNQCYLVNLQFIPQFFHLLVITSYFTCLIFT